MKDQEFFHLRPAAQRSSIEGYEQLSQHLKRRLSDLGYFVDPIQEDWGWWIAVEKQDAKMALGVYCVDEGTPKCEFAVTVFTDNTRRWVFWPFIARSIETDIQNLKQDLSNLFDDDASLVVIDRTADYPL